MSNYNTPVKDSVQAIFEYNGQRSLVLFSRHCKPGLMTYVAPMAMSPMTGAVFMIVSCQVKGLFKREIYLTLQALDGTISHIKVPLASVGKGYEASTVQFLAWASDAIDLLKVSMLPIISKKEIMFMPLDPS